MKYEWDNEKSCINKKKHGLDFKDAPFVFDDVHMTSRDDRYAYGEQRFRTYGELKNRLVVIAHTYRNGNIRIISMRKANEREQRLYLKRLEEARRDER